MGSIFEEYGYLLLELNGGKIKRYSVEENMVKNRWDLFWKNFYDFQVEFKSETQVYVNDLEFYEFLSKKMEHKILDENKKSLLKRKKKKRTSRNKNIYYYC